MKVSAHRKVFKVTPVVSSERPFRVRRPERPFRLRPTPTVQVGPQRFFGPIHGSEEIFLEDLYPNVEYAYFQWRKLYGGYGIVTRTGYQIRRLWENGIKRGADPKDIFPGALERVLSAAEREEIPQKLPARWVRILMPHCRLWLVAQPVHNKHYAK